MYISGTIEAQRLLINWLVEGSSTFRFLSVNEKEIKYGRKYRIFNK